MPTSTQSDFRDYLTREEHNCPNRRVRNRMHGGVGGRGCKVPSYPDQAYNRARQRSLENLPFGISRPRLALILTVESLGKIITSTVRRPQDHLSRRSNSFHQ